MTPTYFCFGCHLHHSGAPAAFVDGRNGPKRVPVKRPLCGPCVALRERNKAREGVRRPVTTVARLERFFNSRRFP